MKAQKMPAEPDPHTLLCCVRVAVKYDMQGGRGGGSKEAQEENVSSDKRESAACGSTTL